MKKFLKLLLCLALVTACGKTSDSEDTKPNDFSKIAAISDVYKSHLSGQFVESNECDSLLFSSLIAAAGGNIDIDQAQDVDKPGRWYRRPTSLPECYSVGLSRSTISRDQILGLLWYAVAQKRLDIVQNLWDYGQSRGWVMGDGRLDGVDTVLNSNMVVLLAKAEAFLGGREHLERNLPIVETDACAGFECHLTVLQVLLEDAMSGKTLASNIEVIKKIAQANPKNPLLQYAYHRFLDGQYQPVVDLMLNSFYPANRLPTSVDVCSAWPMQRTDGDDSLKPCPNENLTHSGGDFIFLAWLIAR